MLNKAILMGRLTGEPEVRQTQSGAAVCSFSLAVQRRYDKEQTDFIDVVAWNKTAEFVEKWFRKGMLVAVAGRIQCRNWEDKAGAKRKSVEVIAEEVHFAERKRETQDMGPSEAEWQELTGDDGLLPF